MLQLLSVVLQLLSVVLQLLSEVVMFVSCVITVVTPPPSHSGAALRIHMSDSTANILMKLGGYHLTVRGQREVKVCSQSLSLYADIISPPIFPYRVRVS